MNDTVLAIIIAVLATVAFVAICVLANNKLKINIKKKTKILVMIASAVAVFIIALALALPNEDVPVEKRPIDSLVSETTENETYASFAKDVADTINYVMTSQIYSAEHAAEPSLVKCVQSVRETCGKLDTTNVVLAYIDSELCKSTSSCLSAQFSVGNGTVCEIRIRMSSKTDDNGLLDIYASNTEVLYK